MNHPQQFRGQHIFLSQIVLSIIYADSKVVNDRVFGQLIFKMPADVNDVLKLRKYLELKNINYKEHNKLFWVVTSTWILSIIFSVLITLTLLL